MIKWVGTLELILFLANLFSCLSSPNSRNFLKFSSEILLRTWNMSSWRLSWFWKIERMTLSHCLTRFKSRLYCCLIIELILWLMIEIELSLMYFWILSIWMNFLSISNKKFRLSFWFWLINLKICS